MATEEKIKVMQAFLDGKKIEMYSNISQSWIEYKTEEPLWNWGEFMYRIKEEPRLIPYSYDDDLLGLKVKSNELNEKFVITYQNDKKVGIDGSYYYEYDELLGKFTHLDDTPCGKLAE